MSEPNRVTCGDCGRTAHDLLMGQCAICNKRICATCAEGHTCDPDDINCEHDWQEQPGEPPVDTCSHCGAVRR